MKGKTLLLGTMWIYFVVFGVLIYAIGAAIIEEVEINFWYFALIALIGIPAVIGIDIAMEKCIKKRG